MTLEELKSLCDAATPGPWLHDWGNWDVESRHPDWYRAEVCAQPSVDPYVGKGKTTDVNADFEFIAAARSALPVLIAIAEAARMLVAPDKYGHCTHVEDSGCPSCAEWECLLTQALNTLGRK